MEEKYEEKKPGIIEEKIDMSRLIMDRQNMLNEQLDSLVKQLGIENEPEEKVANSSLNSKAEPSGEIVTLTHVLEDIQSAQDFSGRLIRTLKKL